MGVFLAIVAVVLIVGGLIMSSMMQGPEQADMSPHGMEGFQITNCKEGAVVPLIFGKVRLTSTLLWYGNLETEEVIQTVDGGKGGDQDVTTGYRYYMDLWHGLCVAEGDVSIISVYSQDKPLEDVSELGTYTLNDGNDTYYPTEPGTYANKMNGVAHIFLSRHLLGENVSTVPTLHFVMERQVYSPFSSTVLSHGINPAAIIWKLLKMAGAGDSDFVTATFEDAAVYWATKDYGLNLNLNSQKKVKDHINTVFTYVDGALTLDNENKFRLRAFKDTDTADYTMDTEDFKKFKFMRKTWDDCFTDFRANFLDREKDYTERTLRARNTAVRSVVGYDKQKTIDLTAFSDKTIASARLWDLMKIWSYPEAQIDITVGLEFLEVNVGDVIEISNSEYDISSADYRVYQKDAKGLDQNEVSFVLVQMLSTLFDDHYSTGGGSAWVTPSYSPQVAAYTEIVELPPNPWTGTDVAFLCLCTRSAVETSFYVEYSPDGSDYVTRAEMTTFAQRGTLDEAYADGDTTMAIDDTVGILFTPYRDDPSFDNLTRAQLFQRPQRICIIDDEIMGFQTVTPEGEDSYRLTGVVRGLFNTTITTHSSASPIWLCNIANNVLTGSFTPTFRTKFLPTFGAETVDASLVTADVTTKSDLASYPWAPAYTALYHDSAAGAANGQNWFTIWAMNRLSGGAGQASETLQFDSIPFSVEGSGDIEWYLSSGTHYYITQTSGLIEECPNTNNRSLWTLARDTGLTTTAVSSGSYVHAGIDYLGLADILQSTYFTNRGGAPI